MEFNDALSLQACLRAPVAYTGDIGTRQLQAWREISAVSWRLARLTSEAWSHTARELLRCTDPLQPGVILMRQVHPAVQRNRVWQERILDLLGGSQAEAAAIAEAYVPSVRYAAAALPD